MDAVLAVAHLQIHNYLSDAAKNSDEIENIPSISKVVLRQKKQKQQQHFSQLGCDRIHFSDRRGRLYLNRFVYSLFGLITHDKTKRHDLEDTLQWKEDGEGCVEVFEDGVVGCRGRVVLKEERAGR